MTTLLAPRPNLKRKLIRWHFGAAALWLLALIAYKYFTWGCKGSDCEAAFIVVTPLFLPPFLVSVAVLTVDITLAVQHFVTPKYKRLVCWLVPVLLLGVPSAVLIVLSIINSNQYNYSIKRAEQALQKCQVAEFGGYGARPYIYLKSDQAFPILVSGGEKAREHLLAAAQANAVRCNYNLVRFQIPAQ